MSKTPDNADTTSQDQIPAEDTQKVDAPTDVSPTKLKVGDQEFTAEDVQKVLEEKKQLEESKKALQADYTKKAQRLSELEKSDLSQKMKDVNSGDMDVADLSTEDIENLKYLEKIGGVKRSDLKQLETKLNEALSDVVEWKKSQEAERAKSQEEATSKRLKEIDAEVNELTAKYKFIDKKELADYMADRGLPPTEAARLLYFDKFMEAGVKPADLPAFEGGSKTNEPTPDAKILELGSREMNDAIKQKLFRKAE